MYTLPKQSTFRSENEGTALNKHRFEGRHECCANCAAHTSRRCYSLEISVSSEVVYVIPAQMLPWALGFPLFCIFQIVNAVYEGFVQTLNLGANTEGLKKKSILMAWRLQLESQMDLGLSLGSATHQLCKFKHTVLIL